MTNMRHITYIQGVMEYIGGETAEIVKLQHALELLHGQGLARVFDLCSPNVMITEAKQIKLIGLERRDKLSTFT